MSRRLLALGALAAATFFGIHRAGAAVIYRDNFARTGDLNGSTPSPTDTSSNTWTSAAGAYTVNNGSVSVPATGPGGSGRIAYLPINVSAAATYTLSATITPNSGTTSDWLALGFTASGATTGQFQATPPNPQLWVLYRDNGGTQSFFGGGTSNGATGGTAATAGSADTFTLSLNSSTGAFSITDTQGLVNRTGTLSTASISAINDVAIGEYQNASGNFSNFQAATSAPEPAGLGLLALGGTGLLARRRRLAP